MNNIILSYFFVDVPYCIINSMCKKPENDYGELHNRFHSDLWTECKLDNSLTS
jgi:hypothetical protein